MTNRTVRGQTRRVSCCIVIRRDTKTPHAPGVFSLTLFTLPYIGERFPCAVFFGSNAEQIKFGATWELTCYFGPLLSSMAIMTFFSVSVARKYREKDALVRFPLIKSAVDCLFYYPALLVVCFLPICVIRLANIYAHNYVGLAGIQPLLTKQIVHTYTTF